MERSGNGRIDYTVRLQDICVVFYVYFIRVLAVYQYASGPLLVRARSLRLNGFVELQGDYKTIQKILGQGFPTGHSPLEKSAKFAILPFWTIFGPACSPDLDECWQSVYAVLYYVQCAEDVLSLALLALTVAEV